MSNKKITLSLSSKINKMSSIHKFKQGDAITRVSPSKRGDRSYMGEKLILIGIANNQIYYERFDSISSLNGIRNVSLDEWDEGWELYVEPLTLLKKLTLVGDAII